MNYEEINLHGILLEKVVVWELLESEYFDDQWHSVGIFDTKQLAKLYLDARIAKLKTEFTDTENEFDDWWKWSISEKTLLREKMALSVPCGGCSLETSCICAAQFYNGREQFVVICKDCWDAGKRCYFGTEGLIVANQPPNEEYREAALYWDEGGYVTGGLLPISYPSQEQNV